MRILIASVLLLASPLALAATAQAAASTSQPATASSTDGKVVVSGSVPDHATEAIVLKKLRKLYGADKVVNNLQVGGVVAPANWSKYVEGMINPNLKQLSHGKINVHGNSVTVTGNVPNEAARQKLLSHLATDFDSHYSISQKLAIVKSSQSVLDQTLDNRTVEFKSGSAILTANGAQILDQMAGAIKKLDDPFILIVGNTDNVGNAASNMTLSIQRANAVKQYLVRKGIPSAALTVSGQGEDNPIASNATPEGRARNRRIEFKIMKK